MSDSVENQTANNQSSTSQPKSTVSISDMLKSDVKSVANVALWNVALLYPFYYTNMDDKVFSSYDSDIVSSAKLASVVAVLSEGSKMLRYKLKQSGVSDKIIYPFGN